MAREPRVLAIDAGGTMTDTFVVDRAGAFVVGKAQTTPEDESQGLHGLDPRRAALLGPRGRRGHARRGERDLLGHGDAQPPARAQGPPRGPDPHRRAWRTCCGWSAASRRTSATPTPTASTSPPTTTTSRSCRARASSGVRERIDLLRRAWRSRSTRTRPARRSASCATRASRGSCVCLLYSYRNSEHEDRVRSPSWPPSVAPRACRCSCPSDLYPLRRDFPRLNSTLIEAYAAEPWREQLQQRAGGDPRGRRRLRPAHHGRARRHDLGRRARARAHADLGADRRGDRSAQYLADQTDRRHRATSLCTDIGGTSFDIALITDGEFQIKPDAGHRPLHPQPAAGPGRLDRRRARARSCASTPTRAGPSSGPTRPAPRSACAGPTAASRRPDVTDLNLVLGRVNPDYFLGGDVTLDADRARAAVEEQIAGPLGLGVEEAAAGVIELFDETLALRGRRPRSWARATRPSTTRCSATAAAGRCTWPATREGVPYRDVLVPDWAAGFSAFGCACGDFAYRYDRTIDLPIAPDAPTRTRRLGIGMLIDGGWQMLREQVAEEFAKSGVDRGRDRVPPLRAHAVLRPAQRPRGLRAAPGDRGARARRGPDRRLRGRLRQALRALAPARPSSATWSRRDRDRLGAGREAGAAGRAPRRRRAAGRRRPARSGGATACADTAIYEQDDIRAGQTLAGPAIVESPADTFAIPPGRSGAARRATAYSTSTRGS